MKIYLLEMDIYNKKKKCWFGYSSNFFYEKEALNKFIDIYKNRKDYKFKFKIREFSEVNKTGGYTNGNKNKSN